MCCSAVQDKCHPQTIAVCETRADGLGLKVIVQDEKDFDIDKDTCGILLQYPATDGAIHDYKVSARDLPLALLSRWATTFLLDCQSPAQQSGWPALKRGADVTSSMWPICIARQEIAERAGLCPCPCKSLLM